MQRNSNSTGRNRLTGDSKSGRAFYTVLAGATLLISSFAVTVAHLGTSLTSAHFASDSRTAGQLTLSQAGPDKALPLPALSGPAPRAVANVKVTALSFQPPHDSAHASISIDLADVRKMAAATGQLKARQAAKAALARKLARLKLARTLLAAQTRSTSGSEFGLAETGTQAAGSTISVAIAVNQSVGTGAIADTDIIANSAPAVMASLATPTIGRPGAILPPAPDTKPAAPRRTSATAQPRRTAPPEETAPVLAYARPGNPEDDESGVFGGLGKLFGGPKGGLPGPASKVAVYDISSATVHMPDGTKLEAHSGIGHRMDNPKYAYVKNYGPTPPNVYRLRMRERRFHGVEAIRMLPLDRAAMKGRDGMLTHTRLLRRSVGSHGCVAFKDYNKFLNAFKRGKVKTLIVVPSMEKLPTYYAQHRRSTGA
ncbi:DUF2778 domain-containing protein [Roseibium sp. AS2]|uniref:DUF2778 domain-containing protein n=1 Tax=Roseibium sp. AS2 TaxID=3135781 RepID=UPI003171E546